MSNYIRTRPGEKDELIGQLYKCNCDGIVATVIQRGWTENWQENIVFLDNDAVWGLEQFFANWKLVERTAAQGTEAGQDDAPCGMESVIKPQYEFVRQADKPGEIGIRRIDRYSTVWFDEDHLLKTIERLSTDVFFHKEALAELRHFDKGGDE